MSSIRLHISVLLKHILEREILLDCKDDSQVVSISNKTKSFRRKDDDHHKATIKNHEDILDFQGPKLILGVKNWLVFYKILGIINLGNVPLWVSMFYKLLVITITFITFYYRCLLKIMSLSIVKGSFRNPILLFISALSFVTFLIQFLVNLKTNLFDLCPFFKILTTPKLCFIKEEALHIFGSKTLSRRLLLHLCYTIVVEMLVEKDLQEFTKNFKLVYFILDLYIYTVVYYHVYGLIQLDFYIRLAFGHWLLALKSHMKQQFALLHLSEVQKQEETRMIATITDSSGSSKPFRTITFDEIQKNLNHMDDHLEVLRSVCSVSLVLITLTSFLGTGGLCLLIYHLVVNEKQYYHSYLLLILSILNMMSLLSTYGGDRWVFYSLGSFVQSVEDEYFLQEDTRPVVVVPQAAMASEPLKGERSQLPVAQSKQMLLVRKKDVLFCREFLHQFENHLATPWSKLTFKSHLHMMRTFVTLVAAQIIFEHEH